MAADQTREPEGRPTLVVPAEKAALPAPQPSPPQEASWRQCHHYSLADIATALQADGKKREWLSRVQDIAREAGYIGTRALAFSKGQAEWIAVEARRGSPPGLWRQVRRGLTNYGALWSSALILALLLGWVLFAWLLGNPQYGPFDSNALYAPSATGCAKRGTAAVPPLKVNDAVGAGAALNIYIGRDGHRVERQTAPLAIRGGSLCPGSILSMSTTDFVRSDGLTLPASQLSAYASVNNDGTEVTVHVWIAPHHGPVVSGAGEYIGTVALDDPRALGASVPVHVYVLYQNISLVLAVSFLAAFGGFTWAWLIHELGPGSAEYGILRNLALRVAVLLVATVPIVSAKVLADSGWQGSLSQYITLITIIGAAAIAATPTLRALVLPSSSRARAPRSDRTSG